MGVLLLVARLVLAAVFAVAGATKLRDRDGAIQAAVDFGIPKRLTGVVGRLLPPLELGVAVALVPLVSAPYAAVAAGALLAGFVAAVANALARGQAVECHCFGQIHSELAGWRTLARNVVLGGIAALVAVAGWDGAGDSALHWLTEVGLAWLVGGAAILVIAALVGFQLWFSLQLLAQNGRTLARLEALEAALREPAGSLSGADTRSADRTPPLRRGVDGGGLTVGGPAPEFRLPDADGVEHRLGSLLAGSDLLMLVFVSAGCGACDVVLSEVAGWQARYAGRLSVAVVAGGMANTNREKAQRHGFANLLLDSDRAVALAYHAGGTPSAVVIDADARIASPTVAGAAAIQSLVDRASAPVPPVPCRPRPCEQRSRRSISPVWANRSQRWRSPT